MGTEITDVLDSHWPGTELGNLLRSYWVPALPVSEIPRPIARQSAWQPVFSVSKIAPLILNLKTEFLATRGNPSFMTRSRD
jgi:hypothetical protein